MKIDRTVKIGKCARYKGGKRFYTASVRMLYENGRLSLTGGITHTATQSMVSAGQITDSLLMDFPHSRKVRRLVALWKRWHLNDLKAGSPYQELLIRRHGQPRMSYDERCALLKTLGLCIDPDYIVKGKPYIYGHAWNSEPVPMGVIAELVSILDSFGSAQ